jgi:hypothetical protein
MGILCELFVANHRDALRFEQKLETAGPPEYIRGEAKGLTVLSFEVLWSVAEGRPFDPHVHKFKDLYFWSHATSGIGRLRQSIAIWKAMVLSAVGRDIGSTWLHEFPAQFVQRLAALDDCAAGRISEGWMRTAEVSSLGADGARRVIDVLRSLARTSGQLECRLYVWGSL